MFKKRSIIFFALLMLLMVPVSIYGQDEAKQDLSNSYVKNIESLIKKNMNEGKIPGMSVIIVKGEQTLYNKGFGYKDIEFKEEITEDTLFELGSTSKAFTGLGIMNLERSGLIKLEDSVEKYIPWFKMFYDGKEAPITIENLLYHTSGIPFKTIGSIPVSQSSDALEKTVKILNGQNLDFYPGERFLYATINYDMLGFIIEKITKKSFEEYMEESVLNPIGLNNTYLLREQAGSKDFATGYKLGFLSARKYNAPMYRGNTPAGYFISNARDMSKWLKVQIGAIGLEADLIEKTHKVNRLVAPDFDGSSYAAGWRVYQNGGYEFSHGGSNPNFSSYLVFRPDDNMGVAVLTNMNSDYTMATGQGIMDLLKGRNYQRNNSDMYKDIDNVCSVLFIICSIINIVVFIFITRLIIDIIKKRRRLTSFEISNLIKIVFSIIFMGLIAYSLYNLPNILFGEMPWDFCIVWGPYSLLPSILALFLTIASLVLYFLLLSLFSINKIKNRFFFPLITLSFASGLGNAIIIFTINEALKRVGKLNYGLMLYFTMGIMIFIIGQKFIRSKMAVMTNDLVYEKRFQLTGKILNSSYDRFEKIDIGEINAGLNNDTQQISNSPDLIVSCLTNIITLICCFVYLGVINIYGLFLSIIIVVIAAGIYFLMGNAANKLWEKTRDIQNIFFSFINDLTNGFKELSINYKKRIEFKEDMNKSCDEYRKKGTAASLKFANAFIMGELIFTLVIGAVVFIFPVIFKDIKENSLQTYVFVFLYMTGPVNGILQTLPQVLQIRISWNRLNKLMNKVSEIVQKSKENVQLIDKNEKLRVTLEGIEYKYNQDDNNFKVGPIDFEFGSGDVIFITGGNGSGKTSFAKLLTGLYKPDNGVFKINNRNVDYAGIGEYYANVFSEYYLFKKLYGIDFKSKNKDIKKYLKLLRIDDKLKILDGEFSTTKLSTGQRKRLALLVSYLEDKNLYLFDEWAADQDPEFRKFFYEQLIIELKNKGKAVIVITHDDRYFHMADILIKMEMGKIIDLEYKKEA